MGDKSDGKKSNKTKSGKYFKFTAKTRRLSMESNKNSTNDNDQKHLNIGGEKNPTINLESQAGEIFSTLINSRRTVKAIRIFLEMKIMNSYSTIMFLRPKLLCSVHHQKETV